MKALSFAVLFAGAMSLQAQSVISARSGLIHYAEGQVFIGDKAVESKLGIFPEVKQNNTLRTEVGRAEVLLTPGVFLRLGENSSIRMITTKLEDTKLEFISGVAILEVDDLLKFNAVAIAVAGANVRLVKNGLYRFDGDPLRLRVLDGAAMVELGEQKLDLRAGKMVTFGVELAVSRFDPKDSDTLNRWSKRRGQALAAANISSAQALNGRGYSVDLDGRGWAWNPYFGMFTFIPYGSSVYSPYGYRYWSPNDVYRTYFAPRPVYTGDSGYNAGNSGNYGYSSASQTSSGYSGTMATSSPSYSAPTTTSSSAASVPVTHSGGSSGGSHR